MSIWNSIGQAAGGFSQGLQLAPELKMKALQLQQMQMAIDQQKQALAAQAAQGNALQGFAMQQPPPGGMPSTGGSQGQPQVPMGGGPGGAPTVSPGASSQPTQQGVVPPVANGAAGGAPPVPQPPTGASSGGPSPPSAPPPGGAPMGAKPPPKAAQIYTAVVAKANQKPPPTTPAQATDNLQADTGDEAGNKASLFDPTAVLGKLAAMVEQQNPGIKPDVLAATVEGLVKQMQGIAPDMRAQLQQSAQQAALQFKYFKQADDDRNKAQALQTRIQIVQMQQAGADQRAALVQSSIDRRAASNAGYKQQALVDKTRIVKANAAVQDAARQLAAAQSAVNSGTGDAAAVETALTNYQKAADARQSVEDDILGSMSGGDAAPAPSPGGGGKPKPSGPSAKAMPVPADRAKDPDGTTYNGGKFVKRGNQIVPVGQ